MNHSLREASRLASNRMCAFAQFAHGRLLQECRNVEDRNLDTLHLPFPLERIQNGRDGTRADAGCGEEGAVADRHVKI